MESTPENLPERLMWFHEHRSVAFMAPLVEAAEEIERLRTAVEAARELRRAMSLTDENPE